MNTLIDEHNTGKHQGNPSRPSYFTTILLNISILYHSIASSATSCLGAPLRRVCKERRIEMMSSLFDHFLPRFLTYITIYYTHLYHTHEYIYIYSIYSNADSVHD